MPLQVEDLHLALDLICFVALKTICIKTDAIDELNTANVFIEDKVFYMSRDRINCHDELLATSVPFLDGIGSKLIFDLRPQDMQHSSLAGNKGVAVSEAFTDKVDVLVHQVHLAFDLPASAARREEPE